MDLALLVLILQIGFNAALNYRRTNRISLIPSSRVFNNELSRRSPSYNQYLPSTRAHSNSDSEQSDFDYSSDEETLNYRSLNSYQRRKNPVKYDTAADNEASLELSPGGRLGSDNHVEPVDTASKDKDYRRPYLRHTQPNRKHGLTPSHIVQDLEDAVHRRAANYLNLLFTTIENTNNRRNLNDGREVPINSLATSRSNFYNSHFEEPANSRRLNHEDRKNYDTYWNYYQPLPQKRSGNIDASVFVPDESNSDKLTALRSNLRLPEPVKVRKRKHSNRRDDDNEDEGDDDVDYDYEYEDDDSVELASEDQVKPDIEAMKNYIQSFVEIKPLVESLLKTYDNANNKNGTVTLDTIIDKLKSFKNLVEEDIEDTEEVKSLRLSDLEDFELPKPKSRSGKLYNRQKDNMNTLRLLISPLDKVTLDEDVSSDLSETLADFKVVPVKLRAGRPFNKKYRREQNDSLKKRLGPQVLRLGIIDNLDAEAPVLRNLKQTILSNLNTRNNYKNLEKTSALRQTPQHQLRSQKHHKHRRSKHTYRNDDDRFIASYNDREDDYEVDFDDSFEDDVSVARSKGLNQNHPSQVNTVDISAKQNDNKTDASRELKPLRSAEEEDNNNEANGTLQLDFPWNDQLSPSNANKNSSSDSDFEEILRSQDSKHKPEDYALDLEYPWTGVITPANNKSDNTNRTVLRKSKDEDQTLDLENVWKSVIEPDDNKSSKETADNEKDSNNTDDQLRSHGNPKDKDNESKPENPVKSQSSPGEGISTEKIPTRTPDPLYEHPSLRQSARQSDQKPFKDNRDSLRQSGNRPSLRQSGNKDGAKQNLRDNKDEDDNSDEDVDGQAFIMVPLDRRPHPRLRTNEVMPYILNRLGPQLRSQTYNDTIIFPRD